MKNALAAASIVLLGACGGGGSGSGSTGSGSAPGGTSTTQVAASFAGITVPAGFSWATVQANEAVAVSVSSSPRPVLGTVRVVVSNYIDQDPTGSGEPIAPMSTDVIATALASNASGPSAVASFGALRLPTGTAYVLVEVFDMTDGTRLASNKVVAASLLASGLTIGV